jgi:hypothetical protein
MPTIRACLAALLAWSSASIAHAQILGTDANGYPVRVVYLSLQAGRTYQIRTDYTLQSIGGSIPDSVLTIRETDFTDVSASLAGNDGNVGGGCGGMTGWAPSCVTFTPSTTGLYTVLLRAWRTHTPGRTNLYWRDVTGGAAPAWTAFWSSALSFGGGIATTSFSGTNRLHVHSQLKPGRNLFHEIWVTASNGAAQSEEWNVIRMAVANGTIADLSTAMTAVVDVNNRSSANLTGTRRWVFGTRWPDSNGNAGAIQLLQNDWFLSGADADGDGLSRDLERSLGSCDRTIDSMATGSCASLVGCPSGAPSGTATSPLCLASMRDTDHDGLHDKLEVYGYNHRLLFLPLWGSDPAHMDVFVEMDTYDQSTNDGCQGTQWLNSQPGGLNWLGGSQNVPFFDRVEQVYGVAPASINPDGLPGIRVHYDVGVNNPVLTDTRWGNFGGGGTCVPTLSMGACNYHQAFNNDPACQAGVIFDDIRKWAFVYAIDGTGGSGQSRGTRYGANALSHHVHELGHVGGLGHAGPPGSTALESNDFGNSRPSFPSRMSYRYQDVGSINGTAASDWARLTFSSGRMIYPQDVLRSPEQCPQGPGVDMSVLALNTVPWHLRDQVSFNAATNCWDVNWDQLDTTPSGVSFSRTYGNVQRIQRYSFIGGDMPVPERSHDAAVAGDVLLYAHVEPDPGGLLRVAWRGDGNADCNELPFGVRSSEGRADPGEFILGGSYPGCYRPGTVNHPNGGALFAIAVEIESAIVNLGSGNTSEGVCMVTNDAGTLRWSSFDVVRTPGLPMEFSYSARFYDGAITSAVPASTISQRSQPALVRVPGTHETLLVYVGSNGALQQASLSAAGLSWQYVRPSLLASGAGMSSGVSPSLATINGDVWMAITHPSTNAIQLYRLEAGAIAAAGRWTLMATYGTTTTRPALVATRNLDSPSQWEFSLLYSHSLGYLAYARSSPSALTSFVNLGSFYGNQANVSNAAAVWDERSYIGDWSDFRVWRRVSRTCRDNVDCGLGSVCTSISSRNVCTIGGMVLANTEMTPFRVVLPWAFMPTTMSGARSSTDSAQT